MEEKKLEEIVMLLSAFLKRNTQQSTLIKELSDVGFQPKRIAELIGTTPNNVRVGLHHSKKKGTKNGK